MSQTLYEIGKEFNQLQSMDFDPVLMSDTLEAMEIGLKEKTSNIAHLISEWSDKSSNISEQIKRLQEMKKVQDNKVKHLKEYLSHNMELMEIDKIECEFFTVTLKKAGQDIVVIDDAELIPEEYKVVKYAPIKAKIKQDIDDGLEVPGAHTEKAKRGLVIK